MKYIKPHWPAPSHIKAYTTLKEAWGPANNQFELPTQLPEPIWLNQTHSTIVVEAKPENREATADASFTCSTQQVCAVLTADCLPLLICNQQGTAVAAIHAGWRGLAKGIIENTIAVMQQPHHELLVWLGPAIGPQKFEVGADVYAAFTDEHPESKTAFIPYTEGKWLANLYELAKLRLTELGISQIYGGEYCTYTQADLFFSYRRDQGKTGRMASLICISSELK